MSFQQHKNQRWLANKNINLFRVRLFKSYSESGDLSSNRFSIDGDQVRRTVKSFNDLTDANMKTSQQLYKEVKEAAELYSHVKRDYYKNTTNPLTIPLKKELQQMHT